MNESTAVTPSRLLRRAEVLARVGMAKSTLYLRISAGKFPKPVHLGSSVRWVESEIDSWIQAQMEQRDQTDETGVWVGVFPTRRRARPSQQKGLRCNYGRAHLHHLYGLSRPQEAGSPVDGVPAFLCLLVVQEAWRIIRMKLPLHRCIPPPCYRQKDLQ
ncbi:TPA: AlpA family transcriptional regulator [Stenotrophomonas maltophilia]|nr:AlpA family transcriptional regulator [Stenotrophomonas maltophilia]HEL3786493.1 AlpA family transcriptional regulator [Stenotrophomonas maltophilia]